MPQERLHRPLPVERKLRKEAGYGCCVCGHPIFQYHHIQPYTSYDPHYRVEDMMILCPNHHDQATQHVMSESEQRAYKAKPHNIENGFAEGQLMIIQDNCRIVVGDSIGLVGEGSLLEIDGESLLSVRTEKGGPMLISAILYDKSDKLLATINNNVWESKDLIPWDIKFQYRKLTIKSKERNIAIEIDARGETVMVQGELWRHSRLMRLGKDGISIPGGGGIANLTLDGLGFVMNEDGGFSIGALKAPISTGLPIHRELKIGRNSPCPCGSGKKFKKCHGSLDL